MDFTRNIINQCICEIFKGADPFPKYKRSDTYEELEENWEGPQDLPTRDVMEDTWEEIVGKTTLKHPYYYKWQQKEWRLDNSKKQELKQAVESVYDINTKHIADTAMKQLILGIIEDTTEPEFLTSLFTNFKTEALKNVGDKAKLQNKTMQELMDIYYNITSI